MQAQAIFEAMVMLQKENIKPQVEIEIPLVMDKLEFILLREKIIALSEDLKAKLQTDLSFIIGTMVELPRACLTADELAQTAEFFSFGTNDLTQRTFGFSRDDAEGKFIPTYIENKIIADNPFAILDREGVGQLMKIAVEKARSVRPGMMIGICGEHGGEASSVEFCHLIGLDYVSCSPYRIPIARLAAAQAALQHK